MPNRITRKPARRLVALLILPALAHAGTAEARRAWPLRVHSHGAAVRTVQGDLTALGIPTSVDGDFGRRTARSVRRWERQAGRTADGRVTRHEARLLAKAAAPKPIAAAETDASTATLSDDGRTALAPADAPQAVKDAIAAANRITDRPYRYGGGHGRFEDSGYDCSGSASYVLHGAGWLRHPRASTGLMSYGRAGRGAWISVYANSGHAYLEVAGLRFDTSGTGGSGPRWHEDLRSGRGFEVRHPPNL